LRCNDNTTVSPFLGRKERPKRCVISTLDSNSVEIAGDFRDEFLRLDKKNGTVKINKKIGVEKRVERNVRASKV